MQLMNIIQQTKMSLALYSNSSLIKLSKVSQSVYFYLSVISEEELDAQSVTGGNQTSSGALRKLIAQLNYIVSLYCGCFIYAVFSYTRSIQNMFNKYYKNTR